MLALVVMTRSRYIRPLLPTSINSKNNSEDSLYFLDLNEATKNVMANVRASKELPHILEPRPIRLTKKLKESIQISDFSFKNE